MHSFLDLVQWWNLLFDLPFAASVILMLLQAMGASHFGHGGHGVHLEHHLPALGGHHIHLPHLTHGHVGTHAGAGHAGAHAPAPDAGNGHALAHHADAGHHAETQGIFSKMLGLLGVGKVPFMTVLSSFTLIWGFTGMTTNLLFSKVFPVPVVYALISAGCAFVSATVCTSAISKGFARLIPDVETYVSTSEALTGKTGYALYEINATSGAAIVLDDHMNRVQVRCRTEDSTVVQKGAQLALLEYHEQSQTFLVRPVQPALENHSQHQLTE